VQLLIQTYFVVATQQAQPSASKAQFFQWLSETPSFQQWFCVVSADHELEGFSEEVS